MRLSIATVVYLFSFMFVLQADRHIMTASMGLFKERFEHKREQLVAKIDVSDELLRHLQDNGVITRAHCADIKVRV